MPRIHTMIAALFALIPLGLVFLPNVARAEKRIALVIGNAGYQAGALNTPANDAGLIAQTLQAAGFDAVGARDLDQDSLRRAFRDFLEKATNAGPDTVAVIYTGGYGVQLEGENYFVPIDAKIARDADVAAQALRISDYTRPLAALKLKATIVVLDAARANPFARSGPPLAGGLALVEPEPGLLMAFNAAPGTVAPEGPGPYGPYAQALAEMLREGGLPLPQVFDRTRLRVNDMTRGAQVPWQASKVDASLLFFERAADAPPPAVAAGGAQAMRARPMRELPVADAYAAALDRDTLDGYADFIDAYPGDPMARRVRAIIAARREAMTWRRTRAVDTPPAYWSYLRRYPQGPHAPDAHRRLAFLAAVLEPPPSFAMLAYDLPPPPPEEIVYIRRPVLVFDDPVFAFAPPPPPPVVFLAPPPAEFVVLAPPPPPVGTLSASDSGLSPGAGVGPSASLRGAPAAEQCHLHQRSQHGRRQQRDQHGDNHQFEWPNPNRDSGGAARNTGRRAGCRDAGSRCAWPGLAALGGAEGRDAAGRRYHARSAGTGADGATFARSGRAAAAGTHDTVSRAESRHAAIGSCAGRRQAWNVADGAGCENTVRGGDAGDAAVKRQARRAAGSNCADDTASRGHPNDPGGNCAGCENSGRRGDAGDSIIAFGHQAWSAAVASADGARTGDNRTLGEAGIVAAGRHARDAAITPDREAGCAIAARGGTSAARRQADAAASTSKTGHATAPRCSKTGCSASAGSCRNEASTATGGAENRTPAAEGVSGREEHGRRQRPSRMQVSNPDDEPWLGGREVEAHRILRQSPVFAYDD